MSVWMSTVGYHGYRKYSANFKVPPLSILELVRTVALHAALPDRTSTYLGSAFLIHSAKKKSKLL